MRSSARCGTCRPTSARAIRQDKTKPIADALHQWLTQQRQKVPDGSATAKAIDYSLKRWTGAGALHRRRRTADRQQLGREPDPADRHRAQQLAVRRQLACGQARRGGDEPGALGAAQRARPLRVPARRARAVADAAGQSHRRVAAASLVSRRARQSDRRARRQDGLAGRLRCCC